MISHVLSHLGDSFSHLQYQWAALALLFQVINLACHAFAYHNVLDDAFPDAPPRVRQTGAAYAAGCAANTFLPARGGEAVKVGLMRMQMPGSSVLTLTGATSIVALFEMLVGLVFLIVAASLGWLPSMPSGSKVVEFLENPWYLAAAVAGLGGLGWLVAGPARRIAHKLASGAVSLRHPVRWARRVASFQLMAWGCRVVVAMSFMAAFGLHPSVRAGAIVVVLGGMSTVASPGGVGAQQALLPLVLAGTASTASLLSFSIGMQVMVSLMSVLFGSVSLIYVCGRVHPVKALRMAIGAHKHDHCPIEDAARAAAEALHLTSKSLPDAA